MGRFNAKSSLALFILSAAVLSGCGGADEGEASQASKRSPLADYRSSSAAKDARRELVGMFTVLNLTAAQAFDQVENNQSAKCDDDAPEQTGGSSPDSPLTWPFSVSVGCSESGSVVLSGQFLFSYPDPTVRDISATLTVDECRLLRSTLNPYNGQVAVRRTVVYQDEFRAANTNFDGALQSLACSFVLSDLAIHTSVSVSQWQAEGMVSGGVSLHCTDGVTRYGFDCAFDEVPLDSVGPSFPAYCSEVEAE